eukprot:6198967-Pleurochrysis_carterae.AAC.3
MQAKLFNADATDVAGLLHQAGEMMLHAHKGDAAGRRHMQAVLCDQGLQLRLEAGDGWEDRRNVNDVSVSMRILQEDARRVGVGVTIVVSAACLQASHWEPHHRGLTVFGAARLSASLHSLCGNTYLRDAKDLPRGHMLRQGQIEA